MKYYVFKYALTVLLFCSLTKISYSQGRENISFDFECPWVYSADTPIELNPDNELPSGTTPFIEIDPEGILSFYCNFWDLDKRTNNCSKEEPVSPVK
jgi:hypothetical protein